MNRKSVVSLITILAALPAVAFSQDARSILDTAQQKQLERWQGVDVYVVNQTIAGQSTQIYFQRTEFQDKAGATQTAFLPASDAQVRPGQCLDQQAMSPEQWQAAAGSMGVSSKMKGSEIDPNQMAQFIDRAVLVGIESVDGRAAFHVRAIGIGQVQQDEGRTYLMDTMSMWVDTLEFVPLRMQVDGTMTDGGETRPMTIENLMTDYRLVPGSNLYEPHRRVMKISGMMDAAQQAEMQASAQKMAEFEQQTASMPASEREQMEKMRGPQLEMMRGMAAGNGFQTEIITNSISINPAMMANNGQPCASAKAPVQSVTAQDTAAPAAATSVSAAAPAPVVTGDALTAMVQTDLTRLGYATGNTTGEPSTETIVAISKFQAENNMEVTGAVTPQLAGVVSAKVSSVNNPPARDPAALQAAQQKCLQDKIAAAQAGQKKKRGFGSLMRAVTRTAGQFGNYDLYQTTSDVYNASATAADLSAAAKDLGLTEDDVEACKNPT
jgi:peptidoglycan hydrolase-like protein with peptidoglycan-binding domain